MKRPTNTQIWCAAKPTVNNVIALFIERGAAKFYSYGYV